MSLTSRSDRDSALRPDLRRLLARSLCENRPNSDQSRPQMMEFMLNMVDSISTPSERQRVHVFARGERPRHNNAIENFEVELLRPVLRFWRAPATLTCTGRAGEARTPENQVENVEMIMYVY